MTLTFKNYIVETVGTKGLEYENKVYKSMVDAGIPGLNVGDKPAAGGHQPRASSELGLGGHHS